MTPYQHYWRKPRVRFVRGQFWRLHQAAMGATFPSGPYATLDHAYRANDFFHAIKTMDSYRRLTGYDTGERKAGENKM